MKTITIEGHLRTEAGKKATRQLRSLGNVPGVIYGGAEEVNFYASAADLKPVVYTAAFQIVEMNVGGKTHNCILKEMQFDKVSDKLIHVDFFELVEDKKVVANLPLKFTGNSIGVKNGGRFVAKMNSLRIKTLPKYLKETIDVDITKLEVNGNIRVEDVLVENMEVMNSPRIPVASVVMTRQLKQEEAAAPAAAKTATPAPAKK